MVDHVNETYFKVLISSSLFLMIFIPFPQYSIKAFCFLFVSTPFSADKAFLREVSKSIPKYLFVLEP